MAHENDFCRSLVRQGIQDKILKLFRRLRMPASTPPTLSKTSTGPNRCDFERKLRRGTNQAAWPPFADTKITGVREESV